MKKSKDKAVDMAVAKVAPGYAEDMKWKSKDALHTIMRAEEHRADKPLMKGVKKEAKGMSKVLEKCCK